MSSDHRPQRIFLVDGIGAILTAAMLLAILAQFEPTFGLPRRLVYILAAIAAGFAIYSLTCYFTEPPNWPRLLRAIAIANLAYCIITLILVVMFRSVVTALGFAYFTAEIIVVSTLAIYELIIAHRAADR